MFTSFVYINYETSHCSVLTNDPSACLALFEREMKVRVRMKDFVGNFSRLHLVLHPKATKKKPTTDDLFLHITRKYHNRLSVYLK